jgi:hypothetical protein
MEACGVVRLFVNKAIVPAELKRRGNLVMEESKHSEF